VQASNGGLGTWLRSVCGEHPAGEGRLGFLQVGLPAGAGRGRRRVIRVSGQAGAGNRVSWPDRAQAKAGSGQGLSRGASQGPGRREPGARAGWARSL
jgi:hypothetical protein